MTGNQGDATTQGQPISSPSGEAGGLASGLRAVLLLRSGLQFPHAPREDWISKVPCVVLLSFQRTGYNNNIIFLWSETSTKNNVIKNSTTKGTMVFIVTLTAFGKFPSQKFLIWFTDLCFGDILHTHQYTWRNEQSFSWKPWPMVLPLLHRLWCSGSNHGLIAECPADWFTICSLHFTIDHISCILACSYRISSIYGAIGLINSLRFLPNSTSDILLVCEAQEIVWGQTRRHICWWMSCLIALTLSPSIKVAVCLKRDNLVCSHFQVKYLVSFKILSMIFYNKDMLRTSTIKPCAQTNDLKIQLIYLQIPILKPRSSNFWPRTWIPKF